MKTPKDFIIDKQYSCSFRRKELIYRVLAILFISLISPNVDYGISFLSPPFLKAVLVSLIRTALLWHGSMWIIMYCTSTFSIFKQPIKLFTIQLALLSTFVVLTELAEIYAMKVFVHLPMTEQESRMLVFTSLLITFLISSIYASFSFFGQWKENLLRTQQLEKANLEAQYETLKAQVNPHFLFNSLNTLLCIVEGHKQAEKYIENLSEFMRYILKNRDKQAVTLGEELDVTKQYVYLQKSRFEDKLNFDVHVPEKFLTNTIPPLTLQMLVENAIKHNEISNEHTLEIRVYIKDDVSLVIENTLKKKIDAEPSTGIGLKNIQSRYQYLFGKEIQINEQGNRFYVILPLTDN